MQRHIESERLLLRPLTLADAPAVFAIASDPEVNRYMLYARHQSIADAEKWLRSLQPETLEFAFTLKESGQLIGTGGLCESGGCYELGYQLRRDAWGRGYATEAAKAIILWASRSLDAHRFSAAHVVDNAASKHVIQKCGFHFVSYEQAERFDGGAVFQTACYELNI